MATAALRGEKLAAMANSVTFLGEFAVFGTYPVQRWYMTLVPSKHHLKEVMLPETLSNEGCVHLEVGDEPLPILSLPA